MYLSLYDFKNMLVIATIISIFNTGSGNRIASNKISFAGISNILQGDLKIVSSSHRSQSKKLCSLPSL